MNDKPIIDAKADSPGIPPDTDGPVTPSLPTMDAEDTPNWVSGGRAALREDYPVYGRLVGADDDVEGLLAFALFEQDRRDWLGEWLSSHRSAPAPAQMEAFVASRATQTQLERYRQGARQALEAYALAAVEYERPLMVEEAVTTRIERAAQRAEAGGRWWRQIGGALVAIVMLAVVLAAVAAGIQYLGLDVAGLWRQYVPGTP